MPSGMFSRKPSLSRYETLISSIGFDACNADTTFAVSRNGVHAFIIFSQCIENQHFQFPCHMKCPEYLKITVHSQSFLSIIFTNGSYLYQKCLCYLFHNILIAYSADFSLRFRLSTISTCSARAMPDFDSPLPEILTWVGRY